MPQTFEIYPKVKTEKWMKVGAKCRCVGEGSDVFTIDEMKASKAHLTTSEDYAHGYEPLGKLIRHKDL